MAFVRFLQTVYLRPAGIIPAVVNMLSLYDLAASQAGNERWPRAADMFERASTEIWFATAAISVVVVTLYGSYRHVREVERSTPALSATWSSKGLSVSLHGQGGVNPESYSVATVPIVIAYRGASVIELQRVTLLSEIDFGGSFSSSAFIQRPTVGITRRFMEDPIDLEWTEADENGLRQLTGLPIALKDGDSFGLPTLWLRAGPRDHLVDLFERNGRKARWTWHLTVQTSLGRFEFAPTTEILMQAPGPTVDAPVLAEANPQSSPDTSSNPS